MSRVIILGLLSFTLLGCTMRAPHESVAYYGPCCDGYSKLGEASYEVYFGLVTVGDGSLRRAMENGKLIASEKDTIITKQGSLGGYWSSNIKTWENSPITKIHHIDREITGWFLHRTYKIIVYGE